MKHSFGSLLCCLTLLMVLFVAGCSKEPIRHLSSDACLIAQGTTKQDVITYMGTPRFKKETATGEVWIFVHENESALKKTPVPNWFFGTVSYDLVYITFSGDIATNCQYRAASEQEYRESVVPPKSAAE